MLGWSKSSLALILALAASPASATFSIVACDYSRACGAAVATNNLAVGASVIYARAGVGAVASQFETNPSYGPKGLALFQAGRSAEAVVAELVRSDDGFEGQDQSFRQVGAVGVKGPGAAFSGRQAIASPWTGSASGDGYSIQGNGLRSGAVIEAMRATFLKTPGPLAERLLAALEAGQAAGGQSSGQLSAALLVRTIDGGFADTDLRVDADKTPIPALRTLLGMQEATSALAGAERAARHARPVEARALIADAIRRGSNWDRVWRRAARLQMSMGDYDQAVQSLAAFMNLNPGWARNELDDPLYAPIRERPLIQTWLAPAIPQPPLGAR